jgi:hypothetical protein
VFLDSWSVPFGGGAPHRRGESNSARPLPCLQRTSAKSRVTTSVRRQLALPTFSSTVRRRRKRRGSARYSITITGETVSVYKAPMCRATRRSAARRRATVRTPRVARITWRSSVSGYQDVFSYGSPAPSHHPEALWWSRSQLTSSRSSPLSCMNLHEMLLLVF